MTNALEKMLDFLRTLDARRVRDRRSRPRWEVRFEELWPRTV